MNSWTLGNPGDQFSLWGVNVLLQATLAAAIALTISLGLRRAPALRYAVLLLGLALILLTPLTAGVMQWSGGGWLSLSTSSGIASLDLVAAVDSTTMEGAAAAPSLALQEGFDATRRFEGGLMQDDRKLSAGGPVLLASGRQRRQDADADVPAPFQDATAPASPADSLATSFHLPPTATWIESALRTAVPPLLLIWFAIAATLLAKLAIDCLVLTRILRLAVPIADAAIQESFAQVVRTLQLRRPPELVLSERVSAPCSAGLIRPRVVLPKNLLCRVTPQQLRDVFVHEVAHVIRRDQAILWLQNVAAALFWFHPLVKALNRQLARAREEICDNHVLGTTDAPTYSRTLLSLARLAQSGSPLPAAVGLFTSRWKLEDRVAGLLDERRSRGTCLTRRNWAFVGAIAVVLAGATAFGTISLAVEDNGAAKQASSNSSSTAPAAAAASRAVTKHTESPPDDGLLTLNLTVRMPNGSPAAGAIVESLHQYPELDETARTDNSGNVAIREVFGQGATIYAHSADGDFQATLKETAPDARMTFAKPVELKLLPAIDHRVVVMGDGKPVADVQVVASGHLFKVLGETGADGVAMLKLPADDLLNKVVAWHPQRGVAGMRDLNKGFPQDSTNLSLLTPAPLTMRVVDPHGKPVAGLELRISVRTEESKDWIITGDVNAAQMKTNQEGETVALWAPRDGLEYVDAQIIGTNWKEDETDRKQLADRIVTVHVRRQKPVAGRLVMPEGVSAEGILVTGFGFGPGQTGQVPTSRARRDGSFHFDCPSEHGFVLGVFDHEWASKPWSGLILERDDDDQAEIAIPVQPAIPVTVNVTRGPNHVPAAGAWVDFEQRGEVHWIGAQGKDQNGSGRIGGWLRTDSEGIARGGAARGQIVIRVNSGEWFEERTLDVKTDDPVDADFHRPWLGNRKVVARMTLDGAAYQPSSNLAAKAWTVRKGFIGPIHQPIIRDDHTIEVNFDEENLVLLVIDREKQLSGFARLGPEADSAELAMQPTATYSGTLLDEQGRPQADRTLRLIAESSSLDVVEPQQIDSAGRFRFAGVPVEVPVRLTIKNEDGLPQVYLFDSGKVFQPGESRQRDQVRWEQSDDTKTAPRPPRPLAERLASACENARVSGMHALLLLQGDASKDVIRLTDSVLELDDESILAYVPATVSASQLKSEAAVLAERKWPQPSEGEIALVALDGSQQPLGMETIAAADVDAGASLARKFLLRHRPASVDARAKLLDAREKAKRDERRVLVISSGPRCGPCFQLARWIDEYHEALEKDYVIVKAMEGLDKHADEIGKEIGGAQHGIPWFIITEPDGKILMTSEGPLGNIGMPSSVEGIRHFRVMLERTARRLSAKEIDELIESLVSAK